LNPRALGRSPRQLGINPCAIGTNPGGIERMPDAYVADLRDALQTAARKVQQKG
jgi:hypothetical protein